jgi:hypothetical protein
MTKRNGSNFPALNFATPTQGIGHFQRDFAAVQSRVNGSSGDCTRFVF